MTNSGTVNNPYIPEKHELSLAPSLSGIGAVLSRRILFVISQTHRHTETITNMLEHSILVPKTDYI